MSGQETALAECPRDIAVSMRIMITGHATLDNAVRSLNEGADAYLTKPVDPDQLLKTIRDKLREQKDSERVTESQITSWIQSKVKRLEAEYA